MKTSFSGTTFKQNESNTNIYDSTYYLLCLLIFISLVGWPTRLWSEIKGLWVLRFNQLNYRSIFIKSFILWREQGSNLQFTSYVHLVFHLFNFHIQYDCCNQFIPSPLNKRLPIPPSLHKLKISGCVVTPNALSGLFCFLW